jgi:hypothetical protein
MSRPGVAIGNAVVQPRKSGYLSSRAGRRWTVKNPTPGTGFLGTTSLVRTTPLIAIYQTSTNTTNLRAQFNLTLASLTVGQVSPVAGGQITLVICTDSVNRYSSGGTGLSIQKHDAATGLTAGFTAKSLPTLTADGSTDQDVWEFQIPYAVPSAPFSVDLEDSVRIGKTGTIFVFAFAAVTAPTLTICAEVIEGQEEL